MTIDIEEAKEQKDMEAIEYLRLCKEKSYSAL
jgi:hypothetical protein